MAQTAETRSHIKLNSQQTTFPKQFCLQRQVRLVTHQTQTHAINETWLAYTSILSKFCLTILSNNQPSAPWHCRDGCVLVTAVYIVNLTQHVLQLNQNQTRIITTADRPTFCASSTAAFFRSFSNCSFVCSSSCSWIASNDTAKQIPPNQTFFSPWACNRLDKHMMYIVYYRM